MYLFFKHTAPTCYYTYVHTLSRPDALTIVRRAVTNDNVVENARLPDIHPALPGKFKRGDKAARKSGLTQRRSGPFGQKAFQYGPVHTDADEPTDALQALFQRHH